MAASSSRFANVSDEEIAELNISAVPKSMQYATKYGVKIFKGKSASLNFLLYFETIQKAIVLTAGVGSSQRVNYNRNSKCSFHRMVCRTNRIQNRI